MYIYMHACRNFVDILKVYRDDVGDVNDVSHWRMQECNGGMFILISLCFRQTSMHVCIYTLVQHQNYNHACTTYY